jgi:hypothetical protein
MLSLESDVVLRRSVAADNSRVLCRIGLISPDLASAPVRDDDAALARGCASTVIMETKISAKTTAAVVFAPVAFIVLSSNKAGFLNVNRRHYTKSAEKKPEKNAPRD